jgi:SAM-dependent methyltransferase
MQLDHHKTRTLARVAMKAEGHRIYPINEPDLLMVSRCSLCGSSSLSPLTEVYLEGTLNFCSTSACNDCLHTFRTISPSRQWFQQRWKQISTKKLEVFNPDVEDIRKRRYEKYNKLLSPYVAGRRMLDIGAAYGTGTKVFQEQGFDVEALEPEDDKANYIENLLKIYVYTKPVEEFVLEQRSYDLVIFAHCLEHLDQPSFVISRMKSLLKKGTGILYVEVPILWNFVTWSDAFYLTHKNNFTEKT